MNKSVYITVPNRKGWGHKHVHFAIDRMLHDGRYKIRHDEPTHSPYVHNLHKCMWDFLDHDEDFWLSIDDDNPPMKNPLDLVGADKDIVGFPTPVWHSGVKGDRPYYFNALDKVDGGWKPHEPLQGLTEVDCIGSGCMLIARRVMEALKDDQPFMRKWDEKGLVEQGGDYSFCEKAKAAGFRIWVHGDYLCDHFCELSLLEVISAFGGMRNG